MTGLGAGIPVFVRSLKVYCWGRNGDECGPWLLNASFGSVVAPAAWVPWFTGSLTFPIWTCRPVEAWECGDSELSADCGDTPVPTTSG